MDIRVKQDTNGITVCLDGRLDTAASQNAQTDLDRLLNNLDANAQMTCDASQLTYISSSGLRILLSLRKRFTNFRMTEVNQEVFQVMEMTGFTKIMNVERAMRRMSVDGCEEIGRGGVGIVYRINDDTIIKVFREGSDIEEVRREITMAKEAFVLGMPTAISFDVVRVGNQYGLVYELLKAETLSTCIRRQPERIDEFARMYAELFRQLHSISVPPTSTIPSVMEREEQAIRHISRYFDATSVDLLIRIAEAVPQSNRLLHCDLQTKNAMMQGQELMLIDMGEVGYGHPMIDLGHAHSAMVAFIGDYEQVIGIPREVGLDLWQRTMHYYFEDLSPVDLAHRMEQIEAIGVVRNFSWLSLSDSFPDSVVRQCQEAFAERVFKRKEWLLDVCNSFADWNV